MHNACNWGSCKPMPRTSRAAAHIPACLLLTLCCTAYWLLLAADSTGDRATARPRNAPRLSDERIVFQTKHGDLELALWPDVAPVTAAHIIKVARLGGYNTCKFFRVDKGFVAQTTEVDEWGRDAALNPQQLVRTHWLPSSRSASCRCLCRRCHNSKTLCVGSRQRWRRPCPSR